MWDGNDLEGTYHSRAIGVEREPMWDGNVIRELPSTLVHPVEREPMWDGNYTLGAQRWVCGTC